MTKNQKTQEVRKAVHTQIKRINRWRQVGVTWKQILKELKLNCNPRILAENYYWRNELPWTQAKLRRYHRNTGETASYQSRDIMAE